MDEAYEPIEGKEKSFLSIYVFLNDDYEGGQSSFLKNWQPSAHDVRVKPKKGRHRIKTNSPIQVPLVIDLHSFLVFE